MIRVDFIKSWVLSFVVATSFLAADISVSTVAVAGQAADMTPKWHKKRKGQVKRRTVRKSVLDMGHNKVSRRKQRRNVNSVNVTRDSNNRTIDSHNRTRDSYNRTVDSNNRTINSNNRRNNNNRTVNSNNNTTQTFYNTVNRTNNYSGSRSQVNDRVRSRRAGVKLGGSRSSRVINQVQQRRDARNARSLQPVAGNTTVVVQPSHNNANNVQFGNTIIFGGNGGGMREAAGRGRGTQVSNCRYGSYCTINLGGPKIITFNDVADYDDGLADENLTEAEMLKKYGNK